MDEAKVTVAARILAKPEKREKVMQALFDIVLETRKEEGCICFDLHQSLDNPCRFRLSEEWESKEALDEHLKKPYVTSFLGKSDTLLAEPVDISLWRMMRIPK